MTKEWLENVPAFFDGYLKLATEDNVLEGLQNSKAEFLNWAKEVPEEKGLYAYDEDKWTVNDMLQHIIDSERIFQYRALCISRGEMNEMPGFDHNSYVKNAKANNRTLIDLVSEFGRLRDSTIDVFASIHESNVKYKGMANGLVVQPLLYGYVLSGHLRHHLRVLQERY